MGKKEEFVRVVLKLKPPIMPNFIRYMMPGTYYQQEAKHCKKTMPITELTRREAEEYAELMKRAFIKHWIKKKSCLRINNGDTA